MGISSSRLQSSYPLRSTPLLFRYYELRIFRGGNAAQRMASSSSRTSSPTKRLLTELQTYQSDPNDALVELGPVDDDELMHWRAVMKGVPGTAYEGK